MHEYPFVNAMKGVLEMGVGTATHEYSSKNNPTSREALS